MDAQEKLTQAQVNYLNGKNATKALEKSAVAPSAVLDENVKAKKRSEEDMTAREKI